MTAADRLHDSHKPKGLVWQLVARDNRLVALYVRSGLPGARGGVLSLDSVVLRNPPAAVVGVVNIKRPGDLKATARSRLAQVHFDAVHLFLFG